MGAASAKSGAVNAATGVDTIIYGGNIKGAVVNSDR